MAGTILQINVSRGGIPKLPIPEGHLTGIGIAGDGWAHPKIHGGPEQAVLLIASELIAELYEEGYPVYPGALGENLTTKGLDHNLWRTGQQYRIGKAVVELTTVRIPCKTLDVYGAPIKRAIYDAAVKRGDPASPVWARSGFYAKVLAAGIVVPGDSIRLMPEASY